MVVLNCTLTLRMITTMLLSQAVRVLLSDVTDVAEVHIREVPCQFLSIRCWSHIRITTQVTVRSRHTLHGVRISWWSKVSLMVESCEHVGSLVQVDGSLLNADVDELHLRLIDQVLYSIKDFHCRLDVPS